MKKFVIIFITSILIVQYSFEVVKNKENKVEKLVEKQFDK
jgi:hypothetical protein